MLCQEGRAKAALHTGGDSYTTKQQDGISNSTGNGCSAKGTGRMRHRKGGAVMGGNDYAVEWHARTPLVQYSSQTLATVVCGPLRPPLFLSEMSSKSSITSFTKDPGCSFVLLLPPVTGAGL